jgi:hypothetical protein
VRCCRLRDGQGSARNRFCSNPRNGLVLLRIAHGDLDKTDELIHNIHGKVLNRAINVGSVIYSNVEKYYRGYYLGAITEAAKTARLLEQHE